MRGSPENISRKIGNSINWIRQHPHKVVSYVVMISGVVAVGWLAQTSQGDSNVIAERQIKEKQAKEAAQEALIKDYEETAGVDMSRVGDTDTFLFTISRKSAVLAGSKEEIFRRVIAKVAKETECSSVMTSIADTSKSTLYSAVAVCPK